MRAQYLVGIGFGHGTRCQKKAATVLPFAVILCNENSAHLRLVSEKAIRGGSVSRSVADRRTEVALQKGFFECSFTYRSVDSPVLFLLDHNKMFPQLRRAKAQRRTTDH